jgi:hypothetical protein
MGRTVSDSPPLLHQNAVIEIGTIPDRKSKGICVLRGSVLNVVAYFRDDESYELFKATVKDANGLRWVDGIDD